MSQDKPGEYFMRKFNGRCVRMITDGNTPPTFEEYVASHKEFHSKEEIEAAQVIYKQQQEKKRQRPKQYLSRSLKRSSLS